MAKPKLDLKKLPFDPLEYVKHLDQLPFDPNMDPDLGKQIANRMPPTSMEGGLSPQ